MGSQLSNTFKLTYGLLFTFAFVFVFINIDSNSLFDFTKLLQLLDYLLAILMVVIGFLGTVIVLVVNSVTRVIGNRSIVLPFTDIVLFTFHVNTPTVGADGSVLNNILLAIFPRSERLFTGDFNQIITDFIQVWAIALAFILLPTIILSSLGFIMRGESRLAITSFVALQILIILAMYTPDTNPISSTGRMMLIDLSFPVFTGTVDSIISDFILLIQKPVFQLGLALYLLLEVAFQTSYAISVVDPMIEREKRIKKHLQRIDNFQPQPEKDKKQSVGNIPSASKKYDILAASYLREMVDRKIFKRGQQLDQKTTMRLQSFISNLRKTDRQFEYKITAKSAQPDTRALLFNAFPSIALRATIVVFLSFLIINPTPIVNLLISNPAGESALIGLLNFPQLAESLELNQPEFRTVIVFNIVLLILFVSAIGHWLLVHKPETKETTIQKVDTLVDFQDIQIEPIEDTVAE
jgi:hypothetical protein